MQGHIEVHTRSGNRVISNSDEVSQEKLDEVMDYFKKLFKENNSKAYITVETAGGEALMPITSVDYIEFVKDF